MLDAFVVAAGALVIFSYLFLDYGDPDLIGGLTGAWFYVWVVSTALAAASWLWLVFGDGDRCDSVYLALLVFTASAVFFAPGVLYGFARVAVVVTACASVAVIITAVLCDPSPEVVVPAAWLTVHHVVLDAVVWPRWFHKSTPHEQSATLL